MRVSEIMHTPAVVCRKTTTLREVANLMGTHDVGSVVVIDNIGYVTGIITDRDVALRGIGEGRSPDVAVQEIMTHDVAAVPPYSDLSEAATVMQKKGIRRVPVIDDMGKVHGMVSFDDLFRHLGTEVDTLTDAVLAQATRLPVT